MKKIQPDMVPTVKTFLGRFCPTRHPDGTTPVVSAPWLDFFMSPTTMGEARSGDCPLRGAKKSKGFLAQKIPITEFFCVQRSSLPPSPPWLDFFIRNNKPQQRGRGEGEGCSYGYPRAGQNSARNFDRRAQNCWGFYCPIFLFERSVNGRFYFSKGLFLC